MGDRLNEFEQKVWRHWFEVTHRTTAQLDDLLQDSHGISLVDFEILCLLMDAPDRRCRMNEIAQSVLVSRSRLTYRVDRLCERGLVRREDDTSDRRGTYACLTEEGHAVIDAARPDHAATVRRLVMDHVEDYEWPVVSDVLLRMSTAARS